MPRIKIPDYMRPNYVVTINGVRYEYPAGTVQDVPQPVYDAIMHYYEMHPQEDPPETEEETINRIVTEKIGQWFTCLDIHDTALTDGEPADITHVVHNTHSQVVSEIFNKFVDKLERGAGVITLYFAFGETEDEYTAPLRYEYVDTPCLAATVPVVEDGTVTGFINVSITVGVGYVLYAIATKTTLSAGE